MDFNKSRYLNFRTSKTPNNSLFYYLMKNWRFFIKNLNFFYTQEKSFFIDKHQKSNLYIKTQTSISFNKKKKINFLIIKNLKLLKKPITKKKVFFYL